MATIIHSISGVLMILGLVAVGYALIKLRIFNDDDGRLSKFLSGFVTKIAIPAYLIVSIPQDFTPASLVALGPKLILPVGSMLVLFILSFGVARLIHVNPTHKGLFQSLLFNSNTVTVGLPVNMALFGKESLPYVLVYYMANTIVFWTLGVYMIESDTQTGKHFDLKKTLKGVFTPPMIALLVAVVLVVFQIKLPAFLVTDLTDLGNTNVPLSLIFIGFSIAKTQRADLIPDKENITLAIGRFVMAPTVMALMMMPFDLPKLLKAVFVIQSAMPTMTNAAVMARELNGDYKFASVSITQTTLMMLVVIPVLMVIVS
ncbi:malate transporter [Weissella confusa]|uniref:AEC family transporter n=1 Tax=Weissella confusa TaxID=1583 RepID=A0AAJ3DC45_WEICO|nr:AEC family transporter [Weissella confusa]MBJ7694411.1 AEC family transporter [Weissella confusa]NBA12420.1 AEC family transporter [Weissella confusa]QBZ04811.1 malate transporter [Weissella confusa]